MGRTRISSPIIVFLLVSAVASPLLAAAQDTVLGDPGVLRATTFATAFGAVVVWVFWPHTRRAAEVTRTGTARALGLAAVLALAVAVVLAVLDLVEGDRWSVLDPTSLPAPLAVVLAAQVLGVAAEEVGWRGVVQPLLERRFSVLAAGLITGLLFGLGHVYVLFAGGAVVYATFVLSAVGLSVLCALLTAGRSILARVVVATCFHWLVNVSMLVLFSDGDESLLWVANTAVATVSVAAAAVLVLRRMGARAGGGAGSAVAGSARAASEDAS